MRKLFNQDDHKFTKDLETSDTGGQIQFLQYSVNDVC